MVLLGRAMSATEAREAGLVARVVSPAEQTVAAALFTAAGAYQMAVWAGQKHKRLLKLFDGKDGRPKYPKRWIMLPPFF